MYRYLKTFQRTNHTPIYYLTAEQREDTDFQQALLNFADLSQKTTQLQINFNQRPNYRGTSAQIRHLRTEIQTQLQGTSLRHDPVRISGQPAAQAQLQQGFKVGTLAMLAIGSCIFALGLMLISRSVLHPLGWLTALDLSFVAGLQLTKLALRGVTRQPRLNWQVLLVTSGLFLSIASLQLIPFSFSYRHRRLPVKSWLLASLTDQGQRLRLPLCAVIAGALSLGLGHGAEFTQISLILIFASVMFNLIFPLLASAIGKLIHDLPHSKI